MGWDAGQSLVWYISRLLLVPDEWMIEWMVPLIPRSSTTVLEGLLIQYEVPVTSSIACNSTSILVVQAIQRVLVVINSFLAALCN
jgi:hypothetical protein